MKDVFKITPAAARINAGMTQQQAAEALGITRSALISWESGTTPLKRYHLIALAAVYHCHADNIFLSK